MAYDGDLYDTDGYEAPRMYCAGCGRIFDLDEVAQDQWDDLRCPDCGSNDLGDVDDL